MDNNVISSVSTNWVPSNAKENAFITSLVRKNIQKRIMMHPITTMLKHFFLMSWIVLLAIQMNIFLVSSVVFLAIGINLVVCSSNSIQFHRNIKQFHCSIKEIGNTMMEFHCSIQKAPFYPLCCVSCGTYPIHVLTYGYTTWSAEKRFV